MVDDFSVTSWIELPKIVAPRATANDQASSVLFGALKRDLVF